MAELRFHWGSSLDGGQKKATEKYMSELLDLDGAIEFAKDADALGVESLPMAQSYALPDPLPIIGALLRETQRVKFILAYRPGLLSPTLFTQIVNTVSWMSEGRIALNIVAGVSPAEQAYYGDFLAHDERYARADEFLQILHALWDGRGPLTYTGEHYRLADARLGLGFKGGGRPEIYVSGASAVAQRTAIRHGDCWFRYADTPEEIAKAVEPVVAEGREAGLRMQVLARETRVLPHRSALLPDRRAPHQHRRRGLGPAAARRGPRGPRGPAGPVRSGLRAADHPQFPHEGGGEPCRYSA